MRQPVHSCDVGVPLRKASGSRFPLQLRALITGLAGFPLQSLTRRVVVVQFGGFHLWQLRFSRVNSLINRPSYLTLHQF